MKLDRRFTNGLAWAGVLLVIGVPTADLLSAQFSGEASRPAGQVAVIAPAAPTPAPLSQRPDAPAAKPAAEVAAVTPAKPVATQTASVVDNFLQSGKPLPSYITGADATPAKPAQVAAKPAATTPAATSPAAPTNVATTPARTPIVTTPAAVDPVQVASIPAKVAPVPMPLSMRPASRQVPVTVAAPITDIFIPGDVAPIPPAMVTSADLEDWESGPLSEFLAKKQGGSSATVTSDYDPNGFYLDEGPNRPRRDRVIGWEERPFLFFAD